MGLTNSHPQEFTSERTNYTVGRFLGIDNKAIIPLPPHETSTLDNLLFSIKVK